MKTRQPKPETLPDRLTLLEHATGKEVDQLWIVPDNDQPEPIIAKVNLFDSLGQPVPGVREIAAALVTRYNAAAPRRGKMTHVLTLGPDTNLVKSDDGGAALARGPAGEVRLCLRSDYVGGPELLASAQNLLVNARDSGECFIDKDHDDYDPENPEQMWTDWADLADAVDEADPTK